MMTAFPAAGRRRCGAALAALLAIGLLAALVSGCGKKGPPLAPLLHLPGAAGAFSARRLGSTVYLQFTVPTKNQDNSTPADVARVEVYGFTGTPANDDEIVKYGTLVAEVPVRRPPSPEEEDRARGKRQEQPQQEQAQKEPPQPKPAPQPQARAAEPEPGFDQGATVTVTETVTPALLEPLVVARTGEKKKAAESEGPILLPSASLVPLPSRVYVVVGVNRKGRRGSFSHHAAVPVFDPPPPPPAIKLAHSETAITIEWTLPPGAPAPMKPQGEPRTPPSRERPTEPGGVQETPPTADEVPLPAKRLSPLGGPVWFYQVYEVPAPGSAPAAPASSSGAPPMMPLVTPPVPLNPQPLTATSFVDARIVFGTERCYVVRAVKSFGTLQEESEASEADCITPRDIYPPEAPKGLTAVANAGAISLIWDPNSEKDLDGYLVLRADPSSGTLQAVTREPIHQTTFNDTTAKPGVRYVYAIVAVDKAGNVSAQSNRIEETAR